MGLPAPAGESTGGGDVGRKLQASAPDAPIDYLPACMSAPTQETPPTGLTTEEVARRQAAGLSNAVALPTSRTYRQILRENVFTFINNVLFLLGLALVALGRPGDAIISVGVILVNVVVAASRKYGPSSSSTALRCSRARRRQWSAMAMSVPSTQRRLC